MKKDTPNKSNSDIIAKYELKKDINYNIIHINGIIGEIDLAKLSDEEIDISPKLQEFFDKK
jgi:hypothetical protein